MKRYFSLVKVGEKATINIYGGIAAWKYDENVVTSYTLSKQLDELDGVSEIDVYINSNGGDVAEGLAIYNALKRKGQQAKVVTYCDGFACSIASVIFMAGTERKMNKASLLMIHNAWTSGMGNADELRKLADDLEVITSASIEVYKENSKISEKKIKELMDAETWIKPKDAMKYGFCTEIIDDKADNPSQSVRERLFNIIMEHEAKKDDEDGTKCENTEDDAENEDENTENDAENGAEDGTEDGENDAEDKDEASDENGEKDGIEEAKTPANLLSGFFNAIKHI